MNPAAGNPRIKADQKLDPDPSRRVKAVTLRILFIMK